MAAATPKKNFFALPNSCIVTEMNLLRTWLMGVIGLLALTSCGLFGPEKPYNQGEQLDPLVLDRDYPEQRRSSDADSPKPIDYLLPWRLAIHD